MRILAAFLLALSTLAGASKILVTVVDPKSGVMVPNLKAEDFSVLDDKTPRPVEAAEFSHTNLDIMMLLDTSLVGEMVHPVATNLIAQLQPKEQMAIVAFHSSADLIQDFTSSKQLLGRAVAQVKYGNAPHVLDALYAAIDGGFQSSTVRRVILLLTAGVEGYSRMNEKDVIRLARKNGVSIYPVYVLGNEKWMMEMLARETGGAIFNLRSMKKSSNEPHGPAIFEVLRSNYTLTVSGNLSLGEKLKVEVRRPDKSNCFRTVQQLVIQELWYRVNLAFGELLQLRIIVGSGNTHDGIRPPRINAVDNNAIRGRDGICKRVQVLYKLAPLIIVIGHHEIALPVENGMLWPLLDQINDVVNCERIHQGLESTEPRPSITPRSFVLG